MLLSWNEGKKSGWGFVCFSSDEKEKNSRTTVKSSEKSGDGKETGRGKNRRNLGQFWTTTKGKM